MTQAFPLALSIAGAKAKKGRGCAMSVLQEVSLKNYDGRRVLTSPLSLRACDLECVQPEQLVMRAKQSKAERRGSGAYGTQLPDIATGKSTPSVGSVCGDGETSSRRKHPCDLERRLVVDKARIREEFLERERLHLLSVVKATYDKLRNSAPAVPPLDLHAAKHKSEAASSTNSRAASARSPHSDMARPKSSREDNEELVRYFEILRVAAEKQAVAAEKWNRKEQKIRALHETLTRVRKEKLDASTKKFQERLEHVKEVHDQQEAELKEKSVKKISDKLQKIEKALKQKEKEHHVSSDPNHGAKEKEAAEREATKRREATERKIASAAEAAQSIKKRADVQRALRDYAAELQDEARLRNAERHEKKVAMERQRMEESVERKRQEQRAAEEALAEARRQEALQREGVARQKELVSQYVAAQSGSATVEPPKWLEAQVLASRRLRTNNGALSARADAAGPSPRSDHAATHTPRPPAAREKFTVFYTSEPSPRQAFSKWMFFD